MCIRDSFLTLGISAQNFGLSLDYMFLQGTKIKKKEVPYISKNGHQALPYSRVLGINYINAINKKLIAADFISKYIRKMLKFRIICRKQL